MSAQDTLYDSKNWFCFLGHSLLLRIWSITSTRSDMMSVCIFQRFHFLIGECCRASGGLLLAAPCVLKLRSGDQPFTLRKAVPRFLRGVFLALKLEKRDREWHSCLSSDSVYQSSPRRLRCRPRVPVLLLPSPRRARKASRCACWRVLAFPS